MQREQVPIAAVALGQEMHLSPEVVGLGLEEYLRRIQPHIELLQRKYPEVLIAAPATPVGRVAAGRQAWLREWNQALGKVPGLQAFTQYGWTEFGGETRRLARRAPEEGWPAYRDFVTNFPTTQLPLYQQDLGRDKKFLITQWGTHADQNTPLQGVHLAHMYFFFARYNAEHNDYFAAATLSIPLAGVEGRGGHQPGIKYRHKVTLYASYLYTKPFRHLFDGQHRLMTVTTKGEGDYPALAAWGPGGERLLYLIDPGPSCRLGSVKIDGRTLGVHTKVAVEAAFAASGEIAPVATYTGEKVLGQVVLEPWSLTLLRFHQPANTTRPDAAGPAEALLTAHESKLRSTTKLDEQEDLEPPVILRPRRPARNRAPFVSPPGLSEKEFIYKQTPQGDLKLMVTFPAGWKSTDRRPGIVFFSGGAWANSLINQFKDRAEYFAGRGMVTVRVDYRAFQSHKTGPDKAVEDARSAVRWLRHHAQELGLDPQRLAAGGSSAGGHLAACTATPVAPDAETDRRDISCTPNALLMVNCVADLMGMEDTQKFRERVPGGEDMARRLSPILHLGPQFPATLILDGDQDRWFELAKTFVDRLHSHGVQAELWIAPGQGHPFSNFSPWREASIVKMDEFLTSLGWLSGKPTLKVPAGAEFVKYTPKSISPAP